ncbi:MAG: guanylate kinase, partial [Nitrospinae bacterium]|nr:guanylate kinase [Nitrospinota bacterium]
MANRGKLLVIDGPSGSGKSTILHALEADPSLGLIHVRRCTTREQRPGDETEGNYRFVPSDEFRRMVEEGEFLEWKDFLFGMSYGTPRREVEELLEAGRNAVAIINLGNLPAVKEVIPDAVGIFISTDLGDLERRLRSRGNHTEEQIAERLGNAAASVQLQPLYDYVVSNDEARLEACRQEVRHIVATHLSLSSKD